MNQPMTNRTESIAEVLNVGRLRVAIRAFTTYETAEIPAGDGLFRRIPLADAIVEEYERLTKSENEA